MNYEIEPIDADASPQPVTDIVGVIDSIIKTHGTTVAEDPYKTQPGTPVSMSFDKRYSQDGRVEFGKKFDVHRKIVGQFELVSARNAEPEKSVLLVNRFEETGGLGLRTWFSQKDGAIFKRLELPPWGSPDMNPHSYIELSAGDCQGLLTAIQNPHEHLGTIEAIVAPSEEELALLDESRSNIAESQQRFREGMESIREAERQAALDSRYVIIY